MVIKLGSTDINKLYLGSTEINKCYLGTTLFYDKTGGGPAPALDPDAEAYITAVETADGQTLEDPVKTAINNFVLGCKADGIWAAIKASCILAGARTLNGALVPLVGAAPTNYNFVSGDYNRKTGLKGNGSTKYIDSNTLSDASSHTNGHVAVFPTEVITAVGRFLMGASDGARVVQLRQSGSNDVLMHGRTAAINGASPNTLIGGSNDVGALTGRGGGATATSTSATVAMLSQKYFVYAQSNNGTVNGYALSPRLAFYSIGEALDLAQLDTRVSNLITAIGAAIP